MAFSENAAKAIRNGGQSNEAAMELCYFMDTINSTVGDAISDMLGVELILHSKGCNAEFWDKMYKDLPNRQLKVLVEDRSVIETEDAERKCTMPTGLQDKIDALVLNYKNGRSFIRHVLLIGKNT